MQSTRNFIISTIKRNQVYECRNLQRAKIHSVASYNGGRSVNTKRIYSPSLPIVGLSPKPPSSRFALYQSSTVAFPRRTMASQTSDPAKGTAGSSIYKWANKDDGAFVRQVSSFRDSISNEPNARFKPEKGRYHLYVSLACPWAHRTLIVRALKGLQDVIGVSVVHYLMGPEGWTFEEGPGVIPDTINNASKLREIYFKAEKNYNGRFTVPILWDKKEQTIVNNESSEIIRMLNEQFDDWSSAPGVNFYPPNLQKDIDEVNSWVYDTINNGVYKAGFATKQAPYEENVKKLFESLEKVESILSNSKYLVGETFTEADIRLFTTIVRFDPVYHGHFKCNLKRIQDYPNLLRWLRRVYQMEGVAETVNMEHIKKHYYMSHIQINPTQVVPLSNGPDLTVRVD